jgi:hypothetical protein
MTRLREIGPVRVNVPALPSYYVSFPSNPTKNGTKLDNGIAYDYLVRQEWMVDEPSPKPPTRFKTCSHLRTDFNWLTTPEKRYSHRQGNSSGQLVIYDRSVATMLNVCGLTTPLTNFESGLQSFSAITDEDREKFTYLADKLKPQLEPKLDLLVFLAELRDIVTSARWLASKFASVIGNGTQSAAKLALLNGVRWRPFSEMRGKASLARIVADEQLYSVSADWISLNFGVLPLFRDVIAIIQAALGLRKQIDDLQKGADKWQKAYASVELHSDPDESFLVKAGCTYCGTKCAFLSTPAGERGTQLRVQYPGGITTRWNVASLYKYSLPDDVTKLSGDIAAFVQGMGIRPSLATAWELIPFSFVVDWFLPLQPLLQRVAADPFPVKTTVMDICASKRTTSYPLVSTRMVCPHSSEVTLYHAKAETYQRVVGSEVFNWIPSFRWPSWFQLSLGAALVDLLWHGRKH